MASDETPETTTPAPAPPSKGWFERLRASRMPGVLAAGLLIAAFGGGYLTAKGLDGPWPGAKGAATGEPGAQGWSLFGKPRGADAPRRGVPKPEGFAVWRHRIDTSKAEPRACVELTRPLDPARSYADFVLVSPDLGNAPAVNVQGAELCVAGVGFADRRVTLLKGLPERYL